MSPMRRSQSTVELLRRSDIFRDYARAFREATGLPLGLRARDSLHLAMGETRDQNPFCVLLAQSNQACAACLSLRRKVEEQAVARTRTLRCYAGMLETAVPVRVGENTIAYLQTGQVFQQPPVGGDFERAAGVLRKCGAVVDLERLRQLHDSSPVVPRRQYDAFVRLLEVFAQHLAVLSNRIIVKEQLGESPLIQRAKAYIEEHQAEGLSLSAVSRSVNTSPYYFCKVFKRSTGLTFTIYLARVRVERAKTLLLNPHVRVSEAAFQVGFQSLSQFNRMFRRITGESPTTYRARLKPEASRGPGR